MMKNIFYILIRAFKTCVTLLNLMYLGRFSGTKIISVTLYWELKLIVSLSQYFQDYHKSIRPGVVQKEMQKNGLDLAMRVETPKRAQ